MARNCDDWLPIGKPLLYSYFGKVIPNLFSKLLIILFIYGLFVLSSITLTKSYSSLVKSSFIRFNKIL